MNAKQLMSEAYHEFGEEQVDSFWSLMDTIEWSPDTSCKKKLIRNLSPLAARKHRQVLDYFINRLHPTVNDAVGDKFLAKIICANILAEKSKPGIGYILANNSFDADVSIEDSFFYDFPVDDDYWAYA